LIKLFLGCIFLGYFIINGQENTKAKSMLESRGEVYIKFNKPSNIGLQSIGEVVSVDKYMKQGGNNEIFAYLNKNQFKLFEKFNINYEVLTAPSMVAAATMCADLPGVKAWNCYPTYSQYEQLMQSFVVDYPDICSLVEFGKSVEGRKLFAIKISDNVNKKEEEPEFFYTSTMHGDEATGYVLMLRLIDYLLKSYSTDSRISELVNSTEIWINPLSNPDGTYSSGNSTLTGATRGNSNNIDLNRNFPGIKTNQTNGPIVTVEHPDGNAWQLETIAMMDFLKAHNFTFSANFHGGAEVVNYAWDAWTSSQKTHADDLWYQEISHQYADTVHANSSNYMVTLDGIPNPSGISNGGDWYIVYGTRQDYVNYYLRSRETTIEISTTKLPVASSLPSYWNYNYRSFLNYINRVHTGVYGKITDVNGLPLKAKISLKAYDSDSSEIFSDFQTGMYYRMLKNGNYQLIASLKGYVPFEKSFSVLYPNQSLENITLQKDLTGIGNFQNDKAEVVFYSNPVKDLLAIDVKIEIPASFELFIYNLAGEKLVSQMYGGVKGLNKIRLNIENLSQGLYFCKIQSALFSEKLKFVKLGK